MRADKTPSSLRYIKETFATEDALLRDIRAAANARGREGMMVGPEEGAMLAWLVKARRVGTIVEVGTFLGYSALWMARALPQGGRLHAIEKDVEVARQTQEFFDQSDVADKITLHVGEAKTVLAGLTGPVDMVFIDADKAAYPAYLDWAEARLRPGGLVVGDNTFLFGTVWEKTPPEGASRASWEAMRAFNTRLADKNRYDAMMIPTLEGMTVAIKREA